MNKWLGVFDKRPLIWFHYVLLTIALFVGFYLFEAWLQGADVLSMFVFWFLVLSISDQLIHFVLKVD